LLLPWLDTEIAQTSAPTARQAVGNPLIVMAGAGERLLRCCRGRDGVSLTGHWCSALIRSCDIRQG